MKNLESKNKKLLLEAKEIFVDASEYDEYELIGCCRLIKFICKEQKQSLNKKIQISYIQQVLKTLDRRTYDILRWRCWEGYTRAAVTQLIGISGARIREIEVRTYERFKFLFEKNQVETNDFPIEVLKLDTRCYLGLKSVGVNTIFELGKLSQQEILNIKGIGPGTVPLIRQRIEEFMFEVAVAKQDSIEMFPIDALNFTNRTTNALKRKGIYTIKQLLAISVEEVYSIRGIGIKCCDEIFQKKQELITKAKITFKETKLPLEDMNLGVRAIRCIQELNVKTVERFIRLKRKEVLAVWHVGELTWQEIYEKQQILRENAV